MAISASDMANQYPLPAFRFNVNFGGESIPFSEVSGLDIERDTITYTDNRGSIHMPGGKKPINLTLKRGMIKGKKEFYVWISSVHGTTIDKKDISISLMDEKGENPLITWTVYNAFPKKLSGPSFNASSNEVALESLELMADDLKVEYA
jgi:phage tail-like protein